MKNSARLRRPVRLYPNSDDSFLGRLVAAFDDIGVGPDEDFDITPVKKKATGGKIRHARNSDPGTSHASARRTEQTTLPGHKERVLSVITRAEGEGLTWKEVEDRTGIENCWRRCSDLKRAGKIVVVGTRFNEDTQREQSVYVAVGYEPDNGDGPGTLFES